MDYNETKYSEQKDFYTEALRNLQASVDNDYEEDRDAFYNAIEDFYESL